MAEALARKYGSDVLVAYSAGTNAGSEAHPLTISVLAEKNVNGSEHVPRRYSEIKPANYDLIVNMSGRALPGDPAVPVETWDVLDPIGQSEEVFRNVRDRIEMLVMHLILRIRKGKFDSQPVSSRQ